MGFRKANGLVGLDIGSSTIKVAEITTLQGEQSLKHFGMVPLGHEAIVDGVIRDSGQVTNSIREIFLQNRIRSPNVALSISGYPSVIKRFSMPFMDRSVLHEEVLAEAEQYLPFYIDDVVMDYQVLNDEDPAEDSGYLDIMLVAAQKELIAAYASVVEAAGLYPVLVDVDAFAVQNIHETIHGISGGNIILLHIGANKMSLNLVKGGKSAMMRNLSMGSRQINAKIRSLAGCSEEEAEEVKLKGSGKGLSEEDFSTMVAQVTDQWCKELIRAVDFFTSTSPEESVDEIVLSGGGARLEDFVRLLARETGFRVSILDPFSAVCVDPEAFDMGHIREMAPQAVVAMGLALRRMETR